MPTLGIQPQIIAYTQNLFLPHSYLVIGLVRMPAVPQPHRFCKPLTTPEGLSEGSLRGNFFGERCIYLDDKALYFETYTLSLMRS